MRLIEQLRWWAAECDRTNFGCQARKLLLEAAEALEKADPQWIPVTERLPEENHDGSVNAVLVTDGFVQHMSYFARGEWRFAESGEIKEPMWYSITHWMPLPMPPEDGGNNED